MAQIVKSLPAMQETWVPDPESGRSPGEGNGNLIKKLEKYHRITDSTKNTYEVWNHMTIFKVKPVCLIICFSSITFSCLGTKMGNTGG